MSWRLGVSVERAKAVCVKSQSGQPHFVLKSSLRPASAFRASAPGETRSPIYMYIRQKSGCWMRGVDEARERALARLCGVCDAGCALRTPRMQSESASFILQAASQTASQSLEPRIG